MKNILITGSNSYIGTSVAKYLSQWPDEYSVDTVDMVDGSWREKDFSPYDVVYHVAGIAHIKKERKDIVDLYFKVNRDMAVETAEKAKKNGVRQFIFMSSMSVYGIKSGVITKDTLPNPKSNYGKSKLQAEEKIASMSDDHFKVAILRPPMVYGRGCKGNYQRLKSFALRSPLFPEIKNQRSMLYIDILSEFLRCIVDKRADGLFFPQNIEYVCTSNMVKLIADVNGKSIHMTTAFNWLIFLLRRAGIIQKVFGNLYYEQHLLVQLNKRPVINFKKSIIESESTTSNA
jgi:UDP-glucose 4-epimerase